MFVHNLRQAVMAKPNMHVFVRTQQRHLFSGVQVTDTGCRGPCSEGPSVRVSPRGVMCAKVQKVQVAAIFDQHVIGGNPVESCGVSPELW
jgi:(2Fe-2S) ferredoxin